MSCEASACGTAAHTKSNAKQAMIVRDMVLISMSAISIAFPVRSRDTSAASSFSHRLGPSGAHRAAYDRDQDSSRPQDYSMWQPSTANRIGATRAPAFVRDQLFINSSFDASAAGDELCTCCPRTATTSSKND